MSCDVPVKGNYEFCGKVKESKTLSECTTVAECPVTTVGNLVDKIPVVLAERTVQIDVESDIELDKPAFEIKRIYKTLFLTQCRLLPRVGKLFLSGYIRKNIEYATADCVEHGAVAGEIRHTTVNVPFECVSHIPYELGVYPQYSDNVGPYTFQDYCPDLMGNSRIETDQENYQFFNEKVYCELVRARFNEVDIQKHICPLKEHDERYFSQKHCDNKNEEQKHCEEKHNGYNFCNKTPMTYEYTFDKITEKLTVHLTFKLLQLQQVRINGVD